MIHVPETRTNMHGFMGMNHRLYTAAEHGPQGELCASHAFAPPQNLLSS